MTNFEKAFIDAHNAKLADSNGKINQTDRNNFRKVLMEALLMDIGGQMTSDGIVLEIEHEYWGSVYAEVSIKVKDTEYDVEAAVEEYEEKQAEAIAKKAEAIQRAMERKLKSEALKAARESKRASK